MEDEEEEQMNHDMDMQSSPVVMEILERLGPFEMGEDFNDGIQRETRNLTHVEDEHAIYHGEWIVG